MAIYINDVKVEADLSDPSRFRIDYNNKFMLVERHVFNHLYDKLDQFEMYTFIVEHLFNENPDMMYDEYFGTDSYEVDKETQRMKMLKIDKHTKGDIGNKGKKRSELRIQELNKSFWGSLIIQDIRDDNN